MKRYVLSKWTGCYVVLIGLLWATTLWSDQVIFKNGRVLNGTVLKETSTNVTVSIGSSGGSIKISRAKLKKIVRGSVAGKSGKKKVTADDVLRPDNAPKAMVPLAQKFKKLLAARREAKSAQYNMGSYQLQIQQCKKELKVLQKKDMALRQLFAKYQKEIAGIQIPERRPQRAEERKAVEQMTLRKKALLAESEKIKKRVSLGVGNQKELLKKRKGCQDSFFSSMQPIMTYREVLESFVNEYIQIRKKRLNEASSEQVKAFFDRMKHYLLQFQKELPVSRIQSQKRNGVTYIQVLVNGKTSGEFVLDTGASNMLITESFAKQLGLPLSSLPSHEVVLANGRHIKVKYGRLESVSVGGQVVRNLVAEVLPDKSNHKEVGLLGMSFLKHFAIRLNGATGEIELMRFMPLR